MTWAKSTLPSGTYEIKTLPVAFTPPAEEDGWFKDGPEFFLHAHGDMQRWARPTKEIDAIQS